MMMHRQNIKTRADRSGLYLAVTGNSVQCQNPAGCHGDAVAKDEASGLWLCQVCLDALYDAMFGVGS